jgi:hypothetical protein
MTNESPLDEVFDAVRTQVPESPNRQAIRAAFIARSSTSLTQSPVRVTPTRNRMLRLSRSRWASLAAALLLMVVGAVAAQELVIFFQQHAEDQFPIPIQVGSLPRRVLPPQTLEEAIELADFTVKLPTEVQPNYTFYQALYDEEGWLWLRYACGSYREFILIQNSMTPDEAQVYASFDVGASAVIETIAIGETTGQYVRGISMARANPNALATAAASPGIIVTTEAEWINDSEIQRLYWYDGGVLYLLYNVGSRVDAGTAGECALNRDDFARAANSLTTP